MMVFWGRALSIVLTLAGISLMWDIGNVHTTQTSPWSVITPILLGYWIWWACNNIEER